MGNGGVIDLAKVACWVLNTGKVNDAISRSPERIYLGDQDVKKAFAQANKDIQGYLDEAQ